MAIYFATFSAVAVVAAQDLFEITAPAAIPVAIREITIGQYSDFGDVQAELLSITLVRGHTVTGAGGSTLTSVKRAGLTVGTAAASIVKANNTTIASAGSTETLISDSMNVAAGWSYRPLPEERIILQPGARLVCRISLPVDSLTSNGMLIFEEIGIDTYLPV